MILHIPPSKDIIRYTIYFPKASFETLQLFQTFRNIIISYARFSMWHIHRIRRLFFFFLLVLDKFCANLFLMYLSLWNWVEGQSLLVTIILFWFLYLILWHEIHQTVKKEKFPNIHSWTHKSNYKIYSVKKIWISLFSNGITLNSLNQ